MYTYLLAIWHMADTPLVQPIFFVAKQLTGADMVSASLAVFAIPEILRDLYSVAGSTLELYGSTVFNGLTAPIDLLMK